MASVSHRLLLARAKRALATGLVGFATLACGEGIERPQGAELAAVGPGVPVTPLVETYPPGPYGGDVGDVVRNYEFEGLLANAEPEHGEDPYARLSMMDLHRGDRAFALLILAESWCVGSQLTAQEVALEAPRARAAGGEVIEVLLDGDRDLTEAWVRDHALPVTTVYPLSPDFETTMGGLEWAILIDLSTQRIVWRDFGSTLGQGAPIAVRGVDELVRRCSDGP